MNIDEFSGLLKIGFSKMFPEEFLKVDTLSEKLRKISEDANSQQTIKPDIGPFISRHRLYELMVEQAKIGNTSVVIKGILNSDVKDYFLDGGFNIQEFTVILDREWPEYTIINWQNTRSVTKK